MSNTTTPMSHWLVHRLQLFACVTAASILAQGCAKQPAPHVTPETDTEAPVTEPVFVPPPPPLRRSGLPSMRPLNPAHQTSQFNGWT